MRAPPTARGGPPVPFRWRGPFGLLGGGHLGSWGPTQGVKGASWEPAKEHPVFGPFGALLGLVGRWLPQWFPRGLPKAKKGALGGPQGGLTPLKPWVTPPLSPGSPPSLGQLARAEGGREARESRGSINGH